MIYVAVLALTVALLEGFSFAAVIRSLTRQQARERDLLINQMCSLAGRPWQPAPARGDPVPEPVPSGLFYSPEQLTDDDLLEVV